MSRPIPRAILERQLDEAMRNDNKSRISSIMKQLQNLNQPQQRRRRRPTPTPIPTRRRRRQTPSPMMPAQQVEPRPVRAKLTQGVATTSTPAPKRATPRRRPPTPKDLLKNAAKTLSERFANMPRRGMTRRDPKTRGQLSQISEAQRRALMTRRPQQPRQELPEYAKSAIKAIRERQQQQPRRLTKQQKQQMNFSNRRDARMKNIRDRMMKRGRSQKDIQRRLFNVDMAFQRRGFNKFGNPQERAAFDLNQKRSREMFDLVQRGGTQKEQFELQKKFQDAMKKGAAPKKRTTVQRQPSIVRSSKGTLVKKNSRGVNDFRKGGLTLSITDNKKKKK